jgi:hypothetical protein
LEFPQRLDSRQWIHADVLQVSLIGAALVLFCLAYFPTLVADYVPEDQWRAFRYSAPALNWK